MKVTTHLKGLFKKPAHVPEPYSLVRGETAFAMICHLVPMVGYIIFIGHILIPLVILLWQGKRSPFIAFH